MERDELAAWLRLILTDGVGAVAVRKLLTAFGLPDAIFTSSPQALQQVVSPLQAAALSQSPPELAEQVETTWAWQQAQPEQRAVVALGDPRYPSSLLTLHDPPLLLYLQGQLNWAHHAERSIAIVGSRNPTPQGTLNARQFAKTLGQAGLTVVSGLALGVDGAAHEGALDAALSTSEQLATIAVVGTGLDRVYPKAHHALAHRICAHGLLLSEYPLGTPPLSANFPKRNRLIAGLASATLVVEAALKSGSLITAKLAAEQGHEVFAIPGSIHSAQSRGCHALIRLGAKLVECAQDVLEDMPAARARHVVPQQEALASAEPRNPRTPEQALLAAIGHDPVSLDALQARTGWDTPKLQALLMSLELDSELARLPGGLFQRLVRA